ncbi:hypothetical protein K440DRAFT_624112 [Wilcoxina mikolae CBS 423.85]|nr:hypothetical protein K440DRAFT_624112 [Wilcoxina mikolae CBS 423.85]
MSEFVQRPAPKEPSWHIPDVYEPGLALPEIPCLCEAQDYDKNGFSGYPERKGWEITRTNGPVRIGKTTATTSSNQAAFLQSWLFFGMLHQAFSILEVEIELDDFVIRHPGNCRSITTFPLRQYFGKCLERGRKRNQESRSIANEQLAKLLKAVDRNFAMFMDTNSPSAFRVTRVLPLDIIISILILGETFLNVARLTIPLSKGTHSTLDKVGFFQATNPLQDRMLQAGWCISTTTMLHNMLDNTGLFIASRLRPSQPMNRQSHATCTPRQCYANNVDEETYETKHTQDCHGCQHISIDITKVVSILRQGQIPLVVITSSSSDSKLSLDVTTSSQYVAISHVWAQGLGNARANSLPSCQLSLLKRVTSGLHPINEAQSSDQLAIWIDTLCIPIGSELKDVRKIAITKLAATYRDADHVLVLDTDLMSSSRLVSRIEKATRILCSAWIRRLWTYQEAVIAKRHSNCEKLQLQFSDGPVTFHSLCLNPRSLCHSEKAINSLLHNLPLSMNSRTLFNFTTLTRVLRYRTTSKYEDEALCLAAVLGHDVTEIAQTKSSERRMQIFYSFIDSVPADILFYEIPKLQIDGSRWAPVSFLQLSMDLNTVSGFEATCSPHGILVTFEALRFIEVTPPKHGGYHYLLEQEAGQHPEKLIPLSGKIGNTDNEWRAIVREWNEFDALVERTEQLALILNPDRSSRHVLVSILREVDGIRYCRYLCLAETSTPQPIKSRDPFGIIALERIPSGSVWCVG